MRDQSTNDENDSCLPPSQAGRIDAICDRFEAAWKAGRRPVIAEFLADVAETDRPFVRAELIALDIAYRKRSGEPATEDDYRSDSSAANHTDSLAQPAKTAEIDACSDAPVAPSGSESPTNQMVTPPMPPGERPVGGVAGAPRPGALPDIPGYRLLAEIGRGGMGVVYRAEHLALKRIVAMKMVLAGRLAHARELNRFRFEAESVARLQHPHIVQVYEIGEHNHLPFFTLEYVDGGSLAHQLARQPRAGRASAALVRTLALAVHAAHQRGILHRDLKPANVLLTAAGEPKITDFGLAKRLDEDSGRTRSGDLIGTPSYMAPEQASGKSREMGTWTDVYALGTILYEMLTGRPPFRGETLLATLDKVLTEDPLPPSAVQPQVPRDLQVICLKCLEKEPARRYASADALAEDLRRFLHGEPIDARPASHWERAVKWCRRHPAGATLLGMSAVGAVLVLAGALAFAHQESARAREANELRAAADAERVRAEENFRHARAAVDEMLTGVSRDRLVFEPRMEQVRRDLLVQALAFYQRFLVVESDQPAVRWEAGRAHHRVGDIHTLLGQHAAAEKSYRAGLDLLRALATEFPDEAENRHDLASLYTNLGHLLKALGRLADADAAYQQALDLHRQMAGDRPDQRRALAAAWSHRGALRQAQHRLAEALQEYQQAEAILRPLAAAAPDNPAYQEELARCLSNEATVQQLGGQAQEAEKQFAAALAIFQRLARQYPVVPAFRQQQATTLVHLGALQRDANRRQAEETLRAALRLREALAGDYPLVPAYRQEAADAYLQLALAQGAGRDPATDGPYVQALKIKAQLVADFPRIPQFRRDLAASHHAWGVLLQTHGRTMAADLEYQRALDLLARLIADFPDEPDYRQEEAVTLGNLGTLQQQTNRPAEAEKSYRRALDVRQKLAEQFRHVPDHRQELARAHVNLGTLLQINRQLPGAEAAYREATGILERLVKDCPDVPDFQQELAVSYNNLGNLLQETQRGKEAEQLWRQAVAILAQMARTMPQVPRYRQEHARTLNQLAILLASTARRAEADAAWTDAVRLQEELVKQQPDQADYRLELARSRGNLAIAQLSDNPPDKALTNFDRAIELLEGLAKDAVTGPQVWPELSIHHLNRASLLQQLGKSREAERSWQRAEALQRELVKAFPDALDHQAGLAQTLTTRGRAALKGGQPMAARAALQEALERSRDCLKRRPDVARFRQGARDAAFGLAEAHLALKDHAAAARTVGEATQLVPPSGLEPAQGVELLAAAMQLTEADPALGEAKKKALMRQYGDQALELLRQSIAGGFRDVNHLKQTPDLAPLRSRDEFHKLIADLELKNDRR